MGAQQTIAPEPKSARVVNVNGKASARVTVAAFTDIAALEGDWRELEEEGVATLYQSYAWCRAWLETAGRHMGVKPVAVAGQDEHGRLLFLLPLQIRRRLGVRVLEWLGAPHGNYGHGLFHRDFLPLARAWFDGNLARVLAAAGRYDAISLREIPVTLQGIASPLAGHFNLRSVNHSYGLHLAPDFEALHRRKRDREDRRMARKKLDRLHAQGKVTMDLPASAAELHQTLAIMFAQQEGRLAERGVHGVFGPAERRFVHHLADLQEPGHLALVPYALKLDGKILAVMLGAVHGGTFWALISSLAPGDIRKSSPGDLALRHAIESCCTEGLTYLDFSSGDSRYKTSWADDVIELRAIVGAVNLRGFAFALLLAAHQPLKRGIKQSPLLMAAASNLRKIVRGRS